MERAHVTIAKPIYVNTEHHILSEKSQSTSNKNMNRIKVTSFSTSMEYRVEVLAGISEEDRI